MTDTGEVKLSIAIIRDQLDDLAKWSVRHEDVIQIQLSSLEYKLERLEHTIDNQIELEQKEKKDIEDEEFYLRSVQDESSMAGEPS